MGIFSHKRNRISKKQPTFPYPICYGTTNPSRTYNVNSDEMLFFTTLANVIDSKYSPHIRLTRMSNGTLSVYLSSYPIGKIKLQGRKHYMQVHKTLHKTYTVTGEINNFIPEIQNWERYIEQYLKP